MIVRRLYLILSLVAICCVSLSAQSTLRGIVTDAELKDPVIGATVVIAGTTTGTLTDWDGTFTLDIDQALPIDLEVSYIGYASKTMTITDDSRIEIVLEEDAVIIEGVEVKATRISEKQKESPLTIEALDIIAIKETPAANFYDGLGSLKGVDLTAASLGFKVINTRGFNSTSPVRSLQIIDGVDNQAPGLNFSLGNFLGSSELDVNKVEIIVGASSAFYGPNAFNGVISMETKDPFFHTGLSAMVKVAERNLFNGAVRWADVVNNKEDNPVFAYKLNFEFFRADDWVADNYDPVDGSAVPFGNPGRWDAVNIYGDEYQGGNDYTSLSISDKLSTLGQFHRTGYREIDLVDYNTENYKAAAALHFKTKPHLKELSPELIFSNSFGSGTTVYQGDNRFSLKGITFLQNRLEYRKANKYFLRAYTTRTGAGQSYDPYFTALRLQENAKDNFDWTSNYVEYWLDEVVPELSDQGYPEVIVIIDPETGLPEITFDVPGAEQWVENNQDLLSAYHAAAESHANETVRVGSLQQEFFEPGTPRFDEEFNRITSELRDPSGEGGGTRFFDNSALYHLHGEYIFTPTWIDKIILGGNGRLYTPESKGTVFKDTADITIRNLEFGFYTGLDKSIFNNKVKLQGAFRADKNQNFKWLFSPAASVVYTPSQNNFFRVSFSSAIRNPTLADQYLLLNVGRATLAGNLDGANDLITLESLGDYFQTLNREDLDSFNISPIQPEQVRTIEAGYRTTLFEKVYVDAGYYFSSYRNFIGFEIGVDAEFDPSSGLPTNLRAFRYSSNSDNIVTTQGLSIGLNYYLASNYSLNGNYSWNTLVKTVEDDPIIPAFNTPEHKFNIGLSGRNLSINLGNRKFDQLGFNINYKWIEGFLFEGSPQFTGFIPSYDMVDAQANIFLDKIDCTLKIGASNLLNNMSFQTYGGPRIGRLAYVSLTYQPQK